MIQLLQSFRFLHRKLARKHRNIGMNLIKPNTKVFLCKEVRWGKSGSLQLNWISHSINYLHSGRDHRTLHFQGKTTMMIGGTFWSANINSNKNNKITFSNWNCFNTLGECHTHTVVRLLSYLLRFSYSFPMEAMRSLDRKRTVGVVLAKLFTSYPFA